jgi:hypothetical protein
MTVLSTSVACNSPVACSYLGEDYYMKDKVVLSTSVASIT